MATATHAKAEVLKDFKKIIPTKKVTFGNEVLSEMGIHNGIFTNPKIDLIALGIINATLNTLNLAAATGDKEAIEERDNYLPIWIDAFDQQADYVQVVANGNTTIIEQSGYHASKTEFNSAVVPDKLMIDAGPNRQHGSIYYKAEAPGHPVSYLAIAAKNNQGPMAAGASEAGMGMNFLVDGDVLKITVNGAEIFIQPSTQRKGDFNGLAPRGAEVRVVMVAFNAAGISPVSEPVSVIIP